MVSEGYYNAWRHQRHQKHNFQYNPHQLYHALSHIFEKFSTCIALMMTSIPNLVAEAGVHTSLYWSWYNQFVYASFNIKIHYPPTYEPTIWHNDKLNTCNIRKSINQLFPEKIYKILLWWKNLLKNIIKIAYSKITYTLLNDKNFNIKLKSFVILKKEVSFNLYQLNWELLKHNILCKYYSKRIAKKKKTRLEKLENMLNFPRNNLIDSIKKQQYDLAKFDLHGIYDSITEGTKLWSRCKQYKEEKNQVISL